MAELVSGECDVMETIRTAFQMRPTFQELAALVVTIGLLVLMGIQLALQQPIDDSLKLLLTAAATYTFGVRSGRATEANHPDDITKTRERIKDNPPKP